MRKFALALLILATCLWSLPKVAHSQEVDTEGGYEGPQEGLEPEEEPGHRSGWFLGSDQGVLFFVGDGADFLGLQYYSTIFGGYNIKGYFQPMIRMGQAIGSAEGFFNPTTFFFIFEGGFRATPIRYKIRPFFEATAGLYILDFDDFGFLIQSQANFTYSAGGGLEFLFGGHNGITVGSTYRGFINKGIDFNGVTVTLGYTFQF